MDIEQLAVNSIRILSADMIEKANSGHPGLPLGAAPAAYELWAHHMNHSPKNPKWMNRDRFVLSAGHGSAMLYSLLHLFGYGDLGIQDLKEFRQLNSLTPGHPEYGHTTGVEATTGPLGAGLGMAVGMAVAERFLAAKFNREGYPLFDHYTYVMCGDGCLMEGISSEAMSFAGTQKLGKLIVLYDSNAITIEGSTDCVFDEDVSKRFESFGFQTLEVPDGNDLEAIGRAIEEAKAEKEKPSFIRITTKIGYGVPAKEGRASAHGEPLGAENVLALRSTLGWPYEDAFDVPTAVYQHYQALAKEGWEKEEKWNRITEAYKKEYPKLWRELKEKYYGDIAGKLFGDEAYWEVGGKADATRNMSGAALNYIKDVLPNLIGGSADLGPSNKTVLKGEAYMTPGTPDGRNIHFGVREMGMTAIANGILLHGGLRSYVATFFVFADYMKPMLRLASLMEIPQIAVLTHDSIGVGEDGPTHEPVEQLAMLRSMPNMRVYRPADETETKAAWYCAVKASCTPSCIVLSRQKTPALGCTGKDALHGGYVVKKEAGGKADLVMISTGTELAITLEAADMLEKDGYSVRVVSMPCLDLFEEQEKEYREKVLLPPSVKRVVVEAGTSYSWGKIAGPDGIYITMDEFGASAPAGQLYEKYGFTADGVANTVREQMNVMP